MNIIIKSIPHQDQRYNTVGDWFYDPDGTLNIRVSYMSDSRFEFLVALHELVEVQQCLNDGVTQQEVDKFDIAYENSRAAGDTSEAGDDPNAPYRKQHFFATNIERQCALALGVDWLTYDREVSSL